MHALVGVLLLVVALGAAYFMYQAGLFQPVTNIFSNIATGYSQSYSTSAPGVTSPYYKNVRIGFVALAPTSTAPSEVDLVAHPKTGGFNISGWVISTEYGRFKIPPVTNLYSPSVPNLPPENIFVRDGDRIRVYTGVSPFGRNERITQSEYRIWLGNFLPASHGTIVLRDQNGLEVDRYVY